MHCDARNKLATAGLCESIEMQTARDTTLADWIDIYIRECIDVAEDTVTSFEKARDNLIDYFGKRKNYGPSAASLAHFKEL